MVSSLVSQPKATAQAWVKVTVLISPFRTDLTTKSMEDTMHRRSTTTTTLMAVRHPKTTFRCRITEDMAAQATCPFRTTTLRTTRPRRTMAHTDHLGRTTTTTARTATTRTRRRVATRKNNAIKPTLVTRTTERMARTASRTTSTNSSLGAT